MKKRMLSLIMVFAMITTLVTALPVFADEEEGVTDEVLLSAEEVQAIADSITWDDIRGENESPDEVTKDPVLFSTLSGAAVTWTCTDTTGALSVYDYYGYVSAYVDRPKKDDVTCTLAAIVTSGENTATKEFGITVKAEGVTDDKAQVTSYAEIMNMIAENYSDEQSETSPVADNELPWAVIDMASYGGTLGAQDMTRYEGAFADDGGSSAKFLLAEAALGHEIDAPAADYADIWSSPYILMARVKAGVTSRDDAVNAELIDNILLKYLNDEYESPYGGHVDLTADTISMAIPALAPFVSDAEVKKAVDGAVTKLSGEQNSDGTFSSYGVSNCETTAQVIVALASVGVDAHTDTRFIKNYDSAVEGLLTFALSDNSGFGHKGNVTYSSMSTEQGFRALVSYARFKEAGGAYNIYLEASDASEKASSPSISVITKPSDPGSGSGTSSGGSNNIKVTFTLYGDTVHGTSSHSSYRIWIKKTNVNTAKGATVGDVLEYVLDKNGYKYEGIKEGYVTGITNTSGVTLSEKSNGANSGWQYSVNGENPEVGLNDCILKAGDDVIWYFTDDYTVDWKPDGSSTSSSSSSSKPADVVITGGAIPAAGGMPFADVSNNWAYDGIKYVCEKGIMTGTGDVTFSPKASLSRAMVVTVLYRLEGCPTPAAVTAGAVYSDVKEGKWYSDAVKWASETGIVNGYGDGVFGTNNGISRMEFAAMLYRYAEFKKYDVSKTAGLEKFEDSASVKGWASESMKWAVGSGVISGVSGSVLDPSGSVTREQAAVMLMRCCESAFKAA